MNPNELGLRDPLTPDQAKAQVIDAAREVTALLGIRVVGAWGGLESCNDQNEAPFSGSAAVHYPLAPGREEARAQTAEFLNTLQAAGWTLEADRLTPPREVRKNGVRVIFEAQGASNVARVITLLGECRDITTTNPSWGPISLR